MLTNLKCAAATLALAGAAGTGFAQLTDESDRAPKGVVKREPTRFVRVLRDEFESPTALQTATAKYVLKDSDGNVTLEVILESVIHIADREYFQEFNRRFRHYDRVLYELVAPPEQRIPMKPRVPGNPLAFVEQLAAEGLGLSRQVDEIDYQAENFVHADLSPAEMAKAMAQRGDDAVTMMADSVLHWVRRTNRQMSKKAGTDGPSELMDLSVLAKPGGVVKLRRMLATQFEDADQLESSIAPGQRLSLIDDRNGRAMDVFQKQLDLGHRKIALFWGAAHMSDFEKRLIVEYGLEPAGVLWRSAWDLREGSVERAPLESLLEKTLRAAVQDLAKELAEKSEEKPDREQQP